jgi:uncharacterized protein (TIGR02996 family)
MSAEGLIRAIRENPGDDAPRLIYADWLDEHGDAARAEFIRVQVELARRGPCPEPERGWPMVWDPSFYESFLRSRRRRRPATDPERGGLAEREQKLLAEHEPAWVGPLWDLFKRSTHWREFRKGFVEYAELSAGDFLARAGALFEWCPVLQDVTLSGYKNIVRALTQFPDLRRVARLELRTFENLNEADLSALPAWPHPNQIKYLWLGDGARQVARVRGVGEPGAFLGQLPGKSDGCDPSAGGGSEQCLRAGRLSRLPGQLNSGRIVEAPLPGESRAGRRPARAAEAVKRLLALARRRWHGTGAWRVFGRPAPGSDLAPPGQPRRFRPASVSAVAPLPTQKSHQSPHCSAVPYRPPGRRCVVGRGGAARPSGR